MKFKLMKRANPAKRDDPMKWYAIPTVYEQLNTHTLSEEATKNTTLAPMEFEGAMNVLAQTLPRILMEGFSGKIDGLGTLRLSFSSDGVEDITKFNASEMIKDPRIILTPDKALLEYIRQNVKFENAGVVVDGFTYATIKDYLTKQVENKPDDGGNSGGGNDGPSYMG